MRTKLPGKEQMLQGMTLFRGLSPKDLRVVASLVDEASAPAGWTLMREGQVGSEAFILVSGRASVHIRDEKVGEIGAGEPVGEMALLDHAPRSATVVADTDVKLLVLTPQTLDQLLTIPRVARAIVQSMGRRLRDAEGAPQHW